MKAKGYALPKMERDFLEKGVDFLEKVALLISVSCQRLVYPPVAFSFFDGFRARNAPPYSCYG